MHVILTRPLEEAGAWQAGLQAAGHRVAAWPLIDFAAAGDVQPARDVWQQIVAVDRSFQAVMFVSARAVRSFFSTCPFNLDWSVLTVRCWATGPGTRRALLEVGVPAQCIDSPPPEAGQFDSEALWSLVAPHLVPGKPVLIVRGDDAAEAPVASAVAEPSRGSGRDWLGQRLQGAGVPVQWLVAYVRVCPVWDEAQRVRAAQAAHDGSVWVFSSSQALHHLRALLPAVDWTPARAIATHERIAQAARALGFGQVTVVRPVLAEVIGSLESAP